MPHENKEAVKRVRGQINRRYIDSTLLNINVVGGTVYLTGVIRTLRTHPNVELSEEMDHISKILRTVPGIREIVWDVSRRT